MNRPLTYEEVLDRHPEQVEDVIRQMKKSRSKFRDTDPATWKWEYVWSVRGYGTSFSEMLQDSLKPKPVLTLAERIEDLMRRTEVSVASHNKWARVSTEVLRDYYTQDQEVRMEEEARLAARSPEEVERDLAEALAYLRGPKNKGFVVFDAPSIFPQEGGEPIVDTMVTAYLGKRK